jgi:hypothetical protein
MKRTSKKRSTLEILGISGVNNYTKIWIPRFLQETGRVSYDVH